MALDQSAWLELLEVLKAADVDDRIRQAATTIYQALIEAELTAVIGAAPNERTEARLGLRNGHRPKTISTVAGDLELRIPKLRAGSFFPSLLERRRRVDQSLFAVIMEAYLHEHPQGRRPGQGAGRRHRDQQERSLPDLRRAGCRGRGVPGPVAGRAAVPLCVLGRDLLQGPRRPPGRLPGRRGGHRSCRRRAPGGARLRRR